METKWVTKLARQMTVIASPKQQLLWAVPRQYLSKVTDSQSSLRSKGLYMRYTSYTVIHTIADLIHTHSKEVETCYVVGNLVVKVVAR